MGKILSKNWTGHKYNVIDNLKVLLTRNVVKICRCKERFSDLSILSSVSQSVTFWSCPMTLLGQLGRIFAGMVFVKLSTRISHLFLKVRVMVFNKIEAMLWRSVLLVEETGIRKSLTDASHWQTLSNNVVSSIISMIGIRTRTVLRTTFYVYVFINGYRHLLHR